MAVRELDFTVRTSIRGVTFPLAFFMSPQPLDSSSPLPLEVLRIEYIGSLGLFLGKGNVAAALPRLRTLSFSCTAVHVSQGTDASLPPLSDFSISNGSLLVVDHNAWSPNSLDVLIQLSERLEELNLSECRLGHVPAALSALTNLRVCYLHGVLDEGASGEQLASWQALGPLRRLQFLSISRNALQSLPPAVAALPGLRGLHLEENGLLELPAGAPCWGDLRELVVDWHAALGSPAALRGATRLTRLVLNVDSPEEPTGYVGPSEAGEHLLQALAALPGLRLVEEVRRGWRHDIDPDVAHVMWHLGRRCPDAQLGRLNGTNVGWTLSRLLAGLEHNKGLSLLQD
ncbi:hypothetical protein CHLNCDRAFT_142110 [Chlorella variabilis]|uniref:Uncharacterized protein n=1 Tax=Chlorella variabilis TaxID=554065 RepID=E1Z7T0_CHLVA|nr:hypothetical protein CHLNCDRAFT_142110 [Chlorella variabilis]EFN58226.1 hypothetical protein CHLNCDRAFT_142110 [Chlorella variabilis]|eukprot:XP_005850328.1 hypothetical protein CHLNCDRAFT_142110 [Chlorella variabilis]